MSDFNEVRIAHIGHAPGNIWLAVHPFRVDYRLSFSDGRQLPDSDDGEPPRWLSALAMELYDALPGLTHLSLSNGRIVIQHPQLFSDDEMVEAAMIIIKPRLEQNLLLSQVTDASTDD